MECRSSFQIRNTIKVLFSKKNSKPGYDRKRPKGTCDEVYRHPKSKNLFRVWGPGSWGTSSSSTAGQGPQAGGRKGRGKRGNELGNITESSRENSKENSETNSKGDQSQAASVSHSVSHSLNVTPQNSAALNGAVKKVPSIYDKFNKNYNADSAGGLSAGGVGSNSLSAGDNPIQKTTSALSSGTNATTASSNSPSNNGESSTFWVQLIVQSPIRSQKLLRLILKSLPDVGADADSGSANADGIKSPDAKKSDMATLYDALNSATLNDLSADRRGSSSGSKELSSKERPKGNKKGKGKKASPEKMVSPMEGGAFVSPGNEDVLMQISCFVALCFVWS